MFITVLFELGEEHAIIWETEKVYAFVYLLQHTIYAVADKKISYTLNTI